MAKLRAAPARETDRDELAWKSASGVSPVPTSPSKSELAEMELLRRVYVMPSNYCGWYPDQTSRPDHLSFPDGSRCEAYG